MNRLLFQWIPLAILLWVSSLVQAADHRNVLLICIDDLRPVLGCYGGAAKTPNLDRFAQSAVTFQRHYVQFPSCGPSRACMMGGVRPDTLRLYGNGGAASVANEPEKRPTMPLLFKNNGYTTLSFGKTYHSKGTGPGFGWSRQPWHPQSGWTCYVNFEAPKGKTKKGFWRPAFEIYDGPDKLHGDYQTAEQAIKALEENRDKRFFIAAGFYKPHLPFVAPKRFWDLYKDEEIEPLEPQAIPQGAQHYQYSFREICAVRNPVGGQRLMATLLFRCSDTKPPTSLIARFRKLTALSIADIRACIAANEPLIEITPFRNDWQETHHLLVSLSRSIDEGSLPLMVSQSLDGDESVVSPEMLRNLIQRYRGIETETQMHTELELGEINDPSEFEPYDEDWTA